MNPTSSTTPHIPDPRRLFIISPESQSLQTVPDLLHSLTGVPVSDLPNASSSSPAPKTTDPSTSPSPSSSPDLPKSTLAGYTTHSPLQIRTKYYSADVSIWVDEVPLPAEFDVTTSTTTATDSLDSSSKVPKPTTSQWKDEFMSADARIVRDAIGAIIVCIQNPDSSPPPPPIPSQPQPSRRMENEPDPATRKDVKTIKNFLQIISDVKNQAEEERDGEDIPIILVLVGRDGSSEIQGRGQQPGKKDQGVVLGDGLLGLGEDEDRDYDVGGEEPFSVEWWEERLFDDGLFGFEVVCWDPRVKVKGGNEDEEMRNRFGEFQGMRRIKEVLETNEWAGSSPADGIGADLDDDDLENELFGFDEGENGFNLEVNELEREMVGLKLAIDRGGGDGLSDNGGDVDVEDDEDQQVESLEALMLRMRAIKDMSAELPEGERKSFAAKAVRDVMKEL